MRKAIIIFVLAFLMQGCADRVSCDVGALMEPVGFWYGLWHGLIFLPAFVVSLFDSSVSIFAVYNNGVPYYVGYAIGLLLGFSGASNTRTRR